MTNKQLSYFRCAKKASYQSDFPKIHIGCVVVNKHKIISKGFNSSTRTHRLQKELNRKRFPEPSRGMLHAEFSALLPLINKVDLTNATIYIYRENLNGDISICRPCNACMALIKACGIKTIYYTTNDGFAKEELCD